MFTLNICRVCLASETALVPLDDTFINDYNLLTNLDIKRCDNMPQHVCQSCTYTVKYYTDFREKCITSETTLKQVLVEKVKPHDSLEALLQDNFTIKQEFKPDKSDDVSVMESCFDDTFVVFDNDDLEILVKKEKGNDKLKRRKKLKKKKQIVADNIKQIDEDIPCGLCKMTFSVLDELSSHIESHKNDTRCSNCSEIFNSWPSLVGHRLLHVKKKKKNLICHLCFVHCPTDANLEYHYIHKHLDGEKSKLKCKMCLRSYDTPKKLRKHVKNVHDTNRAYVCDHCSRSYNRKSLLVSHIKVHSDKKSYVCHLCGTSYKTTSNLRDHTIRRHSLTKVRCKDCARTFVDQPAYEKHKCNQPCAVCPVCGVQIKGARKAQRHMESHKPGGRYKCDRCPAEYKSHCSLKAHINKHDGLRTKQCEYCPLKFYTTSVLIKHRRVHTGEKPYVCKICNKGFTGNHNLKVHMKVHGEYLVVKKVKETKS